MRDVHPYAARLTDTIRRRKNQRINIKFRNLLQGFGYRRRTAGIIKYLILPLMRNLQELNVGIAGMASIGIANETIVATVTRQVGDLRPDDFASCIHSVMSIADDLDDKLIEKYGGTSKKRVPPDTPPSGGRTKRKKKGE